MSHICSGSSVFQSLAPVLKACAVGSTSETVCIETVNKICTLIVFVTRKAYRESACCYAVLRAEVAEFDTSHKSVTNCKRSHSHIKAREPVSLSRRVRTAVEHCVIAVCHYLLVGLPLFLVFVRPEETVNYIRSSCLMVVELSRPFGEPLGVGLSLENYIVHSSDKALGILGILSGIAVYRAESRQDFTSGISGEHRTYGYYCRRKRSGNLFTLHKYPPYQIYKNSRSYSILYIF